MHSTEKVHNTTFDNENASQQCDVSFKLFKNDMFHHRRFHRHFEHLAKIRNLAKIWPELELEKNRFRPRPDDELNFGTLVHTSGTSLKFKQSNDKLQFQVTCELHSRHLQKNSLKMVWTCTLQRKVGV